MGKQVDDGTFNRLFKTVLQKEGGKVDDADDSGGFTNMGISDMADGVKDGKYFGVDIDSITKEQVKEIYYTNYYRPLIKLGETNELVLLHVFDHAINAGVSKAIELYKIAKAQTGDKVDNMKSVRIGWYNDICKGNTAKAKKNKKFLQAWLNRVNSLTLNNSTYV